MKRIVIMFLFFVAVNAAFAQYINLGESLAFVRRDFEQSWTMTAPRVDDSKWTLVQPDSKRSVLKMYQLDLPELPLSGRLTFLNKSPKDFTVVIPFEASLDLINTSDPALYIKEIGQQWAVYLNGVLVVNEFIAKGEHYIERYLKDQIIVLDTTILKRGTNVLAFRLRGDPYSKRLVLDRGSSLMLGSYRNLSLKNIEYHIYILSGVYAFFALFQFVLFLLRPSDKSSLYFGLTAILMGVFLFSRSTYAASIVTNTGILFHAQYYALFLFLPSISAFFESALAKRSSLWPGMNAIAAAVLIVLGLVFKLENIVYVWYLLAIANIVYLLIIIVGISLLEEFKKNRLSYAQHSDTEGDENIQKKRASVPRVLLQTIFISPAGRFFLASLLFGVSAFLDMWLVFGMGKSSIFTPYAFFAFVSLVATVPAEYFSAMSIRVNRINLGLEAEVEARTASLAKAAQERIDLNKELTEAAVKLAEIIKESERDLKTAAVVQKGFYSALPPKNPEWDIANIFEPASGVSANFFDFYEKDGKLSAVSVGTVSGAGIASSLLTVLVRNIMSHGIRDSWNMPLAKAIDSINHKLVRELSGSGSTVSCINLRLLDNHISMVNSSYYPLLIRKAKSDKVAVVGDFAKRQGPLLGQDDYMAEAGKIEIASGDAVLLYSPGLINTIGARGEVFGPAMLMDAFSKADFSSANSLLSSIMLDYKNMMPQALRKSDIVAIMLLKR